MRLLVDEKLSARLVPAAAGVYPGSAHVLDVGLGGVPDERVWEYAAVGGFVLVTKDEDVHRLSVLRDPPPKVVWIRLGNCGTADVVRLLHARAEQIARFVEHEDAAFLALG